MAGPLQGLKVLEFIRVPPGAFCTMVLADMGAEVMKIETPRQHAPRTKEPNAEDERRAVLQFVNRGKRSIAINLKQPTGQELLHKLAADADVLVEGFRPGVMERLGGDYETLKLVNPRLIYCSLSGFGQDGPYRDTPAHDINFLSIAGILNLIGEPDRPPAIPLNLIADYAGASMHGLVGILLALLSRQHTGRGQFVDVSYLDSTLALLAATPMMQAFLSKGVDSHRGDGLQGGSFPNYAVYETADGQTLAVGCMGRNHWNAFCKVIGLPELAEVYADNTLARPLPENAEHNAKAAVQRVLKQKTRAEWLATFRDVRVSVAPLNTVAEAFEDPHVLARHMTVNLAHPQHGSVLQPGIAIKLTETPGTIRGTAPALGEHTDEVLQALGYDETARRELRQTGTVV